MSEWRKGEKSRSLVLQQGTPEKKKRLVNQTTMAIAVAGDNG